MNLNRNLNMLITAGVVLWGLSILLFNQNNEDELAIILVYYWVAGFLALFKARVHWSVWALVTAITFGASGDPKMIAFLIIPLSWLLPLIVYLLIKIGLLHTDLANLMRLPAEKTRAILLTALVWGSSSALYLLAVSAPAFSYGVLSASQIEFKGLATSNATVPTSSEVLSSFNEEVIRAGLMLNGLPNPLLNSLLWVLAHPLILSANRVEERTESAWGVNLDGMANKDAFVKTILAAYFLAMCVHGFLLLWLIKRTHSVWPAVVCHLVHNLLATG